MRRILGFGLLLAFIAGCGSTNVWFTKTDESYELAAKPPAAQVLFRQGKIDRPHRVIGVITAELDRKARRPELDALLISKAREVGADGLMLVEYDADRNVYLDTHSRVVGHGPWRHRVVGTRRRVEVKKTATAIAVVFE